MPACHEESAVTTPTVTDVTLGAVIALAVMGQRLVYACQGLVLFIRHVGVAAVIKARSGRCSAQASAASRTFAADVARAAADGLAADLDPALPVVVCGHSLGGALATLLVADLTANTPLKPQAWTFASPRVGDAIFAARYGGLSTVSWRIYNQVDVVPYFPVDVTDNYQPVTTGYAINSLGKAKWSLGCAHALNTYMHVLSPGTVPLDPACS